MKTLIKLLVLVLILTSASFAEWKPKSFRPINEYSEPVEEYNEDVYSAAREIFEAHVKMRKQYELMKTNASKFGIDWEKRLEEDRKSIIFETTLSLDENKEYSIVTKFGDPDDGVKIETRVSIHYNSEHTPSESVSSIKYYVDVNPDKAHKIEVERIRALLFEENAKRLR